MDGPRATVFAVDDDESFLNAISRVLCLAGYHVEQFSSPAAFLARQMPTVHGCILVDLQMPEMNGLEFQEQLQQRGCSLPVVFLSGHGDIPTSMRAVKAGALDFLTKPVRSADLLRAVEDALARHGTLLAEDREVGALRERYATLSPREAEVCIGVARGLLNKQIAHELGIAEATVKVHRSRALEKLAVDSVPELVFLLAKIGTLKASDIGRG